MIIVNGFFRMDIDYYLRVMKVNILNTRQGYERLGVFILLFLYISVPLFAQKKAVQYSTDFEFKPGIYLAFVDFVSNHPIPPAKIIFNSNRNDSKFLQYVLANTTFTYKDSLGKEVVVKSNDAWGYSSNGAVYVNHGTDFNRVTVIGSLCHFVATIPTKIGVPDPFFNNQSFDNHQQYTYTTEQLILDMESGKIVSFNVENMEGLLARDTTLSKEFAVLKKRQKRDMVFVYLRKYNEKHPIYFPE